jgi:hypothetical protein
MYKFGQCKILFINMWKEQLVCQSIFRTRWYLDIIYKLSLDYFNHILKHIVDQNGSYCKFFFNLAPKRLLNYVALQSFYFEHIWLMLMQKRIHIDTFICNIIEHFIQKKIQTWDGYPQLLYNRSILGCSK